MCFKWKDGGWRESQHKFQLYVNLANEAYGVMYIDNIPMAISFSIFPSFLLPPYPSLSLSVSLPVSFFSASSLFVNTSESSYFARPEKLPKPCYDRISLRALARLQPRSSGLPWVSPRRKRSSLGFCRVYKRESRYEGEECVWGGGGGGEQKKLLGNRWRMKCTGCGWKCLSCNFHPCPQRTACLNANICHSQIDIINIIVIVIVIAAAQ